MVPLRQVSTEAWRNDISDYSLETINPSSCYYDESCKEPKQAQLSGPLLMNITQFHPCVIYVLFGNQRYCL